MAYKQDTQALMGAVIRQGRSAELAKIFTNEKYMDRLQSYRNTLVNNKNKLDRMYKKINADRIKEFEKTNGILDQLEKAIAAQGMYDISELTELLQLLFMDYGLDIILDQDEQDFITSYIQSKLEFLDISNAMQNFNAELIGTNTKNQYYGIFLDNIQGENGEEFSKFLQLTREQYELFEATNPDLFTRRSTGKYEMKLGAFSVNEIYKRMNDMFGDAPDILDQVYGATQVQGQQYNLSTRTIYNFIKNNKDSLKDKSGKILNDTIIKNSRQLELLFDNDLISGIQRQIESSSRVENNKLILEKSNIEKVFQTLDFSKYNQENVGGLVAGDLQFMRNGEQFDYQLKYKGTNMPWNGRTYDGVINHLNTYINTGQKFLSDPSQMINLAEGLITEDQFLSYLDASPTAYSHMEEIGYQTVSESFMTMAEGYDIEIW